MKSARVFCDDACLLKPNILLFYLNFLFLLYNSFGMEKLPPVAII